MLPKIKRRESRSASGFKPFLSGLNRDLNHDFSKNSKEMELKWMKE
jgi:hypothetical protein